MKFKFLILNIMAIVELLSMHKLEQEMSCLGLQLAIYKQNMQLIEEILKQPLNLDILYMSEDLSPLMIAATKIKSKLIVGKLLDKGASILLQNSKGKHVMDLVMDIVNGPQASNADVQILGFIFPYYFNAITCKVAVNQELKQREKLIFKKQEQ